MLSRMGRASGAGSSRLAMLFVAVAAVAVSLAAVPASAEASTLYVDRGNAACSDSGPGTENVPYCTIAGAAKKAVAGQTVVVASGTYSGQVTVTNSGTPGAAIVFEPAPGASVTVTSPTKGFSISGKSWIVIRGFSIRDTDSYAVYLATTSNVTVSDNDVSYSGHPEDGETSYGIYVKATTDSLVAGNTVHHNTNSGIYLVSGSTRVEVRDNVTFANARGYTRAATGIDVRSAGNTIAGNLAYDNEDSGIQFYSGASENLAFNNVAFGNGDHGIDVLNSPGLVIVSNTVFHNTTSGINVEGTSSGATLANNISVDNAMTNTFGQKGNIRVDSQSVSGTTVDHDLVHLSSPGTMMLWGSTKYSSLASFRAATGQEAHGIEADPAWEAPEAGDFHLAPGSPAIDSANSGAPGQPPADVEGNPRVDDPGTPNTGAGVRTYDDRGAYEHLPSGNLPPIALPDAATTPADTPVAVEVLANDTDPDGDPLSVSSVGSPEHGTATADPSGTITYRPAPGFSGLDSFTYTVSDGRGGTASATVAVEVTFVESNNTSPQASDDAATTPEDTAVTVEVLANDADPDGDPLSVSSVGSPQHGTATADPSGIITYTPAPNFNGPDGFTYTASDGRGGMASASVVVEVTAVDDPPTANAQSVSTDEGMMLLVTLTGSDPDGSPVGFQVTALPANGTLHEGSDPSGHQIATSELPYTLPGATVTYVPGAEYTGADSFSFAAHDGTQAGSPAAVSITVRSTNLVGNPGFETNTAGWNTSGNANVTLTRVSGGRSGDWAAALTNTGTANTTCTLNDAPNWVAATAAGTYRAKVWVRADAAGAVLQLRLREYNGSTFVGSASAQVTLSTAWQLVTVSYVPGAPGSSNIDLNAYTVNAPPGTCFYADDVSISR
jgi:parallel beta-helix repeat protein